MKIEKLFTISSGSRFARIPSVTTEFKICISCVTSFMNAVRNSGFHLYAICSSRGISAGVVCVFSAKITGAWFEYSVKSPF